MSPWWEKYLEIAPRLSYGPIVYTLIV